MLKKMLAELIGTFFLMFAIGMTAVGVKDASLAPIAIGVTLMVMVFACGHISGAHFNPAVTLAVTLRGKCKWSEVPLYVGMQLVGAGLAACTVVFLKGHAVEVTIDGVTTIAGHEVVSITDAVQDAKTFDMIKALTVEAIATFGLVWVVLNVATAKGTAGNSFYGIAIGGTVAAMAFAVGGISGGAFNPAVTFGLVLLNVFTLKCAWYLLAQLGAAVIAALLFNMTHDDNA